MIKDIYAQLKRDEGEVKFNGRHYAYEDHLGFATIGFGRLIDDRRGGGLTDVEAHILLEHDVANRIRALETRLPWYSDLSEPRQGVLLNMAFQLGVAGLMGFKKTLRLVQIGKYEDAADEMLRSKWSEQTPQRAKRLAQQMILDEWQ